MSLDRIGVLIVKDLQHGAGNLFFILAFVYPIGLSLLVTLVFGDIFDQKARLGIVDEGESALTGLLLEAPQLDVRLYDDRDSLRRATENGVIAVGLVIAADFDSTLQADGTAELTRFVWGEALANDQLVIESAVQTAIVDVADTSLPIRLESNQLGEADVSTWPERLLPVLIIMTVTMGGVLLPASALVDEKENRTLIGLTVTPTTLFEVYMSKAIIGILVSILMGVVVLIINNAFGNSPVLLMSLLALSSVAASIFGVIMGTLTHSVNGLLAAIKAIGFVLYLPGLLAIFPDIPVWTQQIFPTYYIMNPIIEVSQNRASFGDIVVDIGILLGIIGMMLVYLASVFERQQQRLVLAE